MEILRKDANNTQLEYTPYSNADFEKTSSESEVSKDPRDWPGQIIQEFASQHPYAYQQSAPEIEFEKVDEKSGSAFGALILRKPYQVTGLGGPRERMEAEPEKIAVPIVIGNFQLQSFEVFIHGEKVMPLTESRFAEVIGPQSISNGIDPYFQPSPLMIDKFVPPTAGYLGNLYGNYSLSGGEGNYSNWTPTKGAQEIFEPKLDKTGGSADTGKSRTFLSSLRTTISQADFDDFRTRVGDERGMCGFSMNKTMQIVREIMGSKPTSYDDYMDFIEGSAPVHLVCLKKLSNARWLATETNDYYFKPVKNELTQEQVLAKYSTIEPRLPTLMQESEEILLESGDRVHIRPIILEEKKPIAECVEEDGHYLALTTNGGFTEGQIFCQVRDYAGNRFPAKLFISGNSYTLQEQIVGERLGDVYPEITNGSIEAGADGTFIGSDEGGQFALLPFKVTNVGWVHGYMVAQGVGMDNENVAFVMMPGVTRFVNATGIADPVLGSQLAGSIYFIPPSFRFVNTGSKIHLECDPREVRDKVSQKMFFATDRNIDPFSVETTRKGHSRSLRVLSEIGGTFTLKGAILATLDRDEELQACSMTHCHWIMSTLGVPLKDAAKITAMALADGECNVSNLRPAKAQVRRDQVQDRNLAELASVFRRNLFKEASTISDPKSVDAMLSLNFVNERNLIQFLDNIELFREVENKLAELYLYIQMGLKDQVPEQAALNAMKSINEVNEHLEYLMAQMQAQQPRDKTPQPAK